MLIGLMAFGDTKGELCVKAVFGLASYVSSLFLLAAAPLVSDLTEMLRADLSYAVDGGLLPAA